MFNTDKPWLSLDKNVQKQNSSKLFHQCVLAVKSLYPDTLHTLVPTSPENGKPHPIFPLQQFIYTFLVNSCSSFHVIQLTLCYLYKFTRVLRRSTVIYSAQDGREYLLSPPKNHPVSPNALHSTPDMQLSIASPQDHHTQLHSSHHPFTISSPLTSVIAHLEDKSQSSDIESTPSLASPCSESCSSVSTTSALESSFPHTTNMENVASNGCFPSDDESSFKRQSTTDKMENEEDGLLSCLCSESTKVDSSMSQNSIETSSPNILYLTPYEYAVAQCGRRMFLGCLILATKYIQEPCPSNQAWSKLSLLSLNELAMVERIVLKTVDYSLHVGYDEYAGFSKSLY